MLTAVTRSVRYKVLAVVLVTTLIALLVSTATLLTYEAQAHRDFLISDATTQADILAQINTPALQFDDPVAARENLALLGARHGIIAAAIYDSRGEIFARFQRIPEASLPGPRAPGEPRFVEGTLELFHPITANGQVLGTVYLRADDDLAERLQDFLLILGLVMLMSLAVALLISAYLQRSVTAPVLAVTDVARRVMADRDFSLRAKKTTDDEVGVLVDSFNAMLAEVGQTTAALETTNRQLLEESDERRSAEAALRLADRRKDEFLATLAHELRNPLAPMTNAVWIMDTSTTEGHTREARDIIRRQLDHMVRLIDDLLDVSRITRGKLSMQMETVEFGRIIRNAIDTAQTFIDEQRHTLAVDVPDHPVFLHGDAVRLSQLFSNLLDNAAKYTPPGGRIRLMALVSGEQLAVEISDNGIGMSADTLESVFEMFVQGTVAEGKSSHAGLGVGLGLAKRLVTLHGGTIEARSDGPGRGSTFTVTLKVVDAPAAATPAEEIPEARTSPCAEPRRILLVDDNTDFVDSMARLLRSMGHDVRVAYDGVSAIDVAREFRPEVGFLDLGLPQIDGYELARALRRQTETADTVLVALSGWGQDKDIRRSREHGFVTHLVKPVDVHKVLEALDSLVESH